MPPLEWDTFVGDAEEEAVALYADWHNFTIETFTTYVYPGNNSYGVRLQKWANLSKNETAWEKWDPPGVEDEEYVDDGVYMGVLKQYMCNREHFPIHKFWRVVVLAYLVFLAVYPWLAVRVGKASLGMLGFVPRWGRFLWNIRGHTRAALARCAIEDTDHGWHGAPTLLWMFLRFVLWTVPLGTTRGSMRATRGVVRLLWRTSFLTWIVWLLASRCVLALEPLLFEAWRVPDAVDEEVKCGWSLISPPLQVLEGQEPADAVYEWARHKDVLKHRILRSPLQRQLVDFLCDPERGALTCTRREAKEALFVLDAGYDGLKHRIPYLRPDNETECPYNDPMSRCSLDVVKEMCRRIGFPEGCGDAMVNAMRNRMQFYDTERWKGQDLYKSLGLRQDVTNETIQEAFKKLSEKYEPRPCMDDNANPAATGPGTSTGADDGAGGGGADAGGEGGMGGGGGEGGVPNAGAGAGRTQSENKTWDTGKMHVVRRAHEKLSDADERWFFDQPCEWVFGGAMCKRTRKNGDMSIEMAS